MKRLEKEKKAKEDLKKIEEKRKTLENEEKEKREAYFKKMFEQEKYEEEL